MSPDRQRASSTQIPDPEPDPGGKTGSVRRVVHGVKDRSNWTQLVRFGLVGASGYVVNLAVFALLIGPAGLHHVIAAVGAFCVAVSNNYFWNKRWTFAGNAGTSFQAARFFTVSVAALGVNLGLLELLVGVAGMVALAGQAIAVGLAMPVNFIGNKLWTFGRRL